MDQITNPPIIPINQNLNNIDSQSNVGRNFIIVLFFIFLAFIIIGPMHFHLYSKINQDIADFKTWDETNK